MKIIRYKGTENTCKTCKFAPEPFIFECDAKDNDIKYRKNIVVECKKYRIKS